MFCNLGEGQTIKEIACKKAQTIYREEEEKERIGRREEMTSKPELASYGHPNWTLGQERWYPISLYSLKLFVRFCNFTTNAVLKWTHFQLL